MNHYLNRGGNSNVLGYTIGDDFITVYFKGAPRTYTYSYYGKAGSYHVEQMKQLAVSGQGLNSYIMKNVKDKFD